MGDVLGQLGREDEARPFLEDVALLAPGTHIHEASLWRLFRLLRYLGYREDARRQLLTLLETFRWSRFGPRSAWALAWDSIRSGKWNDAEPWLQIMTDRYAHEYFGITEPRAIQAAFWQAAHRGTLDDTPFESLLSRQILVRAPMSYYAWRIRSARVDGYSLPDALPVADHAAQSGDRLRATDPAASLDIPFDPVVAHAVALIRIGERDSAMRELARLLRTHGGASAADLRLALLLEKQDWSAARQLVVSRLGDLNLLHAAFRSALPKLLETPLLDLFREAREVGNVPMSLLYAIAWTESGFDPGAHSVANAYGLLQLIPQIETIVVESLGWDPRGRRALLEPSYNLMLGSIFVSGLLRACGYNLALTALAYNVGPPRVNRWLTAKHTNSVDQYLETVPYEAATRYARKVTMFALAYSAAYPEWNEMPAVFSWLRETLPNRIEPIFVPESCRTESYHWLPELAHVD